ncbi:hypothetical protein K3495_g13041 [Podosphaera aphanis]|nr:hypothetical protein K3495_g13041 [Podosphaera aphanis]
MISFSYAIVALAETKCKIADAKLPVAPKPLPNPEDGLVVKHVAIGAGSQNYTCTDPTEKPTPIGAVATLYDASCIASSDPKKLDKLSADAKSAPPPLTVSGVHYFSAPTVAIFDLRTAEADLGIAPCHKTDAVPAPAKAAVPWLKLATDPGATGGLKEIYRVVTYGGVAPETCGTMPATFEVPYVAQYWFFAEKS